MAEDGLTVSGALEIKLDGEVVHSVCNTVTSDGKTHIADQLAAVPTQAPMTNMAIGTGTPGASALGTELKRKAFKARTSSGAVVTYIGFWDIDDNVAGTITEAGLFNAPQLGGTMLCSASFGGIIKAVQSTLEITWTLTFT